MRLRDARLNLCFTLREVSDDLNMSLSYLCKIEKGMLTPSDSYKEKLINYYKLRGMDVEFPETPDYVNKIKALNELIAAKDLQISVQEQLLEDMTNQLIRLKNKIKEAAKLC